MTGCILSKDLLDEIWMCRPSGWSKFFVCALIAVLLPVGVAFAGEFEGRYRVGPTSCQVSPSKMSFEVRWAKGSGAMYFFFDETSLTGKMTYVSGPKKNGKDRFEFDSDEHDSGRFVRSDGKVFFVKRMQEQPPKAAR